MNTNRFRMTALVALASMGAGALAPNEAMAWYSRINASACTIPGGTPNVQINGGVFENDDTAASQSLYCPIVDSDAQPRFSSTAGQSLAVLNAEVDDESTGARPTAQACMNDYQSFSSECGTPQTASNPSGHSSIPLATHFPTDWATSADSAWFAYMLVNLGPFAGGGHEYLFGYYYSN